MTGFAARRLDPQERAGLRLTLLGVAVVLAGGIVLPLALLVREQWEPLARFDERVSDAAREQVLAHDWLLTTARVVTDVGDPLTMTVLTVLLAAALFARGSRRLALFVVLARLGAQVLSTTTKVIVDRARPSWPDPVSTAGGASFPSGHTLATAAFLACALVVALSVVHRLRALVFLLAVLLPLLVGASRVLLGVHYLSDVTAALLLGFGWVAALTAVFATWRREEGRPVHPLEEGLEPELDR